MTSDLTAQFKRPHGALGALAGWIMANRGSNIARNRWTVALLELEAEDRVLEIGCGPGEALQHALRKTRAGCVVGLDHSPLMIAQAARRNRQALRSGSLELFNEGVEALPRIGRQFTKAMSVNVAQFFDDKPAAFRTLSDALEPGGLLATTYQPRSANASDTDGLRMIERFRYALSGAGFIEPRLEILSLRPVSAFCLLARKPR